MEKHKVYVTRKLPRAVIQSLESVGEVTVYDVNDEPVPRAVLLESVKGTHGILSMLTDTMDAEVMDAAGPCLKVIANMAVGYDNIDVAAAKERGIVITNTPDVLTESTADLTFSLLLAAARRIPEAERVVREGHWNTWSPFMLAGQDVFGKTLGILGLGRIGEAVARRASGFQMRVLYHNRTRRSELEAQNGYKYVSLHQLLAESDFLVVLTPLTEQTRHLIGAAELAQMKPTSILVNVARGPVVDEQALYQALRTEQIWAAGLDVFAEEPLPSSHPLTTLRNVVLLPHIGSSTVQTRFAMAQLAVDNIVAVLSGKSPITSVNT